MKQAHHLHLRTPLGYGSDLYTFMYIKQRKKEMKYNILSASKPLPNARVGTSSFLFSAAVETVTRGPKKESLVAVEFLKSWSVHGEWCRAEWLGEGPNKLFQLLRSFIPG